MVTICTAMFNITKLYVLCTQCIYVFCVDLRTNSDYFSMYSINWLVLITEWYELNLHIFSLIPVFVEARVRCWASWCAIYVGQSATDRCLNQYFLSPCQYHSIDALFTLALSPNASKSRVVVSVHPIRCAHNVGQ